MPTKVHKVVLGPLGGFDIDAAIRKVGANIDFFMSMTDSKQQKMQSLFDNNFIDDIRPFIVANGTREQKDTLIAHIKRFLDYLEEKYPS